MTTLTAPARVEPRPHGPLTSTGALVRFALRRDRVRLPAWVLGISLTLIVTAASLPGLYPDDASRQARAAIMGSPAAIAMGGPQVGVADYTFGAMMTNEMLGWAAIFVALMALLAVVRHTRAEEDTGRAELVLAAPVGRLAPLVAALVVAVGASVAVGVITAVGLASLGIATITWPGSLLYGAALASVGIVFAGIAAVTAQVSESSRGAAGLAGLFLGIAYVLRAIGDAGDVPALSWLSPIGWAQRTYAYVDDRWWPLAIPLALTVVLLVGAVALRNHRDFGAGLRQPTPGPAHAKPSLRTPVALAWRLQRTSVLAWLASIVMFGLMYGTLFGAVEDFASASETVHNVLDPIAGGGADLDALLRAFMSLVAMILAMAAAIFAILASLRARSEEDDSRAEVVLATPVSRSRWLAGYAVIAGLGAVAMTVGGAAAVGLSGGIALGDGSVLGDIVQAGLVQSVPVLLVASVAVALYGWWPRAAGLAWVVLGYGMFVGTFGGLLGLPKWAIDANPFAIVPLMPAEPFDAVPVVGMLVVTAGLYGLGFAGLRRRDLRSGA